MAKYLVKASYTATGAKGLLKDGGSKRRAVVEQVVGSLGGRLEAFYYAFGEADAILVVDLPDTATAAAVSIAINATGTVEISTVPLISAEEIDEACKKQIPYRAPGG